MNRTRILRVLRFAAGMALLAWLVMWVEWRQLLAALLSCDPYWAAAGLAFFIAATFPAALRLKLLLPPHVLTYAVALRLTLASHFLGQLLPSGLGGDAYRSFRLKDDAGGWIPTIGLLAVERAVSASTLILPALAWALLRGVPAALLPWRPGVGPWLLGGLFIALALLLALAAAWRPARLHDRLRRVGHAIGASLRRLSWTAAVWIVVLSFAFHVFRVLGTLAFLAAIGFPVELGGLVIVMATTLLASLVPVSVGALGVREGILVHGLASYGVPLAGALTVALLGRLAVVLLGVAGAAVLHADRRPRLGEPDDTASTRPHAALAQTPEEHR